ncbi:hypothetical protein CEQ90_00885 [Lewinellaceae bacterium SD302]|nr:hypothetical protein CEQ90_00885 [Lewinellaceae bacterium SD302]
MSYAKLNLIWLLILTGCVVDDDAIVLNNNEETTYCCVEGPEALVSDIALLKLGYETDDTVTFINQFGDMSSFYISNRSSSEIIDTIYQPYSDGYSYLTTSIDTIGFIIYRHFYTITLTSDDLDLNFKITASTQLGKGGIRQELEIYDVLLISTDRIFGNDFAGILFRRDADQFASVFGFTQLLPSIDFNGISYENAVRMRNLENGIYYVFTRGIIAFTDPITNQTWSLLE